MSGETVLTVIGNLVDDPALRFTPSGAAVANFTIASTPRTFDKASGEWRDGEALFMRCSLWRQAAEQACESLTRGMRVIAIGSLKQRSYEKDGQKRTVVELDVEEIGPSLKYATAKVTKAGRSGGSGGAQRDGGNDQQRGSGGGQSQQNTNSGWGGQGSGSGWGGNRDDAPPF